MSIISDRGMFKKTTPSYPSLRSDEPFYQADGYQENKIGNRYGYQKNRNGYQKRPEKKLALYHEPGHKRRQVSVMHIYIYIFFFF